MCKQCTVAIKLINLSVKIPTGIPPNMKNSINCMYLSFLPTNPIGTILTALETGTSLSADPNIASRHEACVSILERLLDKIRIVPGACLRDSRDRRNLDQAILANGDKTIESYGS